MRASGLTLARPSDWRRRVKIKLRFLLPSLAGILTFLTPIRWNGNFTIGIEILTGWFKDLLGIHVLHIVVGVLVVTSILTVLGTVFKVGWIRRHRKWKDLFDVPVSWLGLRVLGTVFGLMYLFQFGPELLISDQIGGAVFVGIAVEVLPIYIFASLLMPLLTGFGFMEFAGTLARPVFRRVFRLPGRSAIDAVTSFVGAASIGLLITIGQYNSGNYTTRQACAIATNFSVVAIPFALVVATVAGIGHLFVSWYGFVVLACLLAAVITPRLPPLSRKAETYVSGLPDNGPNTDGRSNNLLSEAWERALERAESSPGIRDYFAMSLSNMMFFLFSVMAAAMALATLAALITFHTPIFTWLSYPFITVLEFAEIPDAAAASPALFAGFMDQYIPAIVATGIDSHVTSFVLAGLSVCQLIFLSEVGVIILRSSLPITISDLAVIFLLRTAITLPVLIVGAHLVAG
jgi:nucleoside recognition membrane protein YjiH